MAIITDKLGFEIETCTRCGGTGEYSYCQQFGTRCFKCGGAKVCRTKRGAIAYQMFIDSLKVRADSLRIGDKAQMGGVTVDGTPYDSWVEITKITECRQTGASLKDGVMVPYDLPGLLISGEHPKRGRHGIQCGPEHMIRKGHTAEEKAPKLAAALAYQACLTKAGTVRKAAA